MSDNKTPCQATSAATLRDQIMDSRIPKNEREWWAARTIEKLERELADLQKKSAREVFAKGVYLGPRGTGSMPQQQAPEWWYDCFNQGYHDMSIFEIEWAYDGYLKHQKAKP